MPPGAFGVGAAAQLQVQVQRLQPGRASLRVLAEGRVRVAEVVEGVGGFGGVAEGAEQDESFVVVVDGLVMVAGVVLDET